MTNLTKLALATTTAMTLATASAAVTDATVKNAFVLDSNETIVENAMLVRNLTTLVSAIETAGLAPALMGEGPFTVFAPINSAFGDLGEDEVNALLLPENREQLVNVLQMHVVPGEIMSSDLDTLFRIDGDLAETEIPADLYELNMGANDDRVVELQTLGSLPITISSSAGDYYIETNASGLAEVIVADIPTSNGVIHIIDGVIVQ